MCVSNPIEKAWREHPECRKEFIENLIIRYAAVIEWAYQKMQENKGGKEIWHRQWDKMQE